MLDFLILKITVFSGTFKSYLFWVVFFLDDLTCITDKSWDLRGLSQLKLFFIYAKARYVGARLRWGVLSFVQIFKDRSWWSLRHLQNVASTDIWGIQYLAARQRKRKRREAWRTFLWARLRYGINHNHTPSANFNSQTSVLSSFSLMPWSRPGSEYISSTHNLWASGPDIRHMAQLQERLKNEV